MAEFQAVRTRVTSLLVGLALALPLLAPQAASAQSAESASTSDPFAQAAGSDATGDAADPFAAAAGEGGGSGSAGGFGGGDSGALPLSGFVQWELGRHIGPKGVQERDLVLNNIRARLKTSLTGDAGSAFLKVDFLRDDVTETSTAEIREARVLWTPFRQMDVNLGIQVSTWGVGDMVFINDLFPKNWIANFTGQELEFLKEPANAARISLYAGPVTWDVVYTPRFAPDVVPTGCRFSVFDPNSMALVANPSSCRDAPSYPPLDSVKSRDGEVATRLMTDAAGFQLALYGYRGFWKSPRSLRWIDPATGLPVTGTPDPLVDVLSPYHSRLAVYGFSAEGQAGPGILALEGGRYDSLDDPNGDDPLIENSQRKGLLGYRMDFSASFSAGVQWMVEETEDYEQYLDSLNPASSLKPRARSRDTYTLRLTYKAQQDTLILGYFGYHRPDDRDGLHKFWLTKRVDNHLEVSTGANVFHGEAGYEDREFGMLRFGDNAFVRATYNF